MYFFDNDNDSAYFQKIEGFFSLTPQYKYWFSFSGLVVKKQKNYYKKQKNYCNRLYKKEGKKFFSSLSPSFVKDNNLFWKTVKPFFLNKGNLGPVIKLVEKNELIQNDQ